MAAQRLRKTHKLRVDSQLLSVLLRLNASQGGEKARRGLYGPIQVRAYAPRNLKMREAVLKERRG